MFAGAPTSRNRSAASLFTATKTVLESCIDIEGGGEGGGGGGGGGIARLISRAFSPNAPDKKKRHFQFAAPNPRWRDLSWGGGKSPFWKMMPRSGRFNGALGVFAAMKTGIGCDGNVFLFCRTERENREMLGNGTWRGGGNFDARKWKNRMWRVFFSWNGILDLVERFSWLFFLWTFFDFGIVPWIRVKILIVGFLNERELNVKSISFIELFCSVNNFTSLLKLRSTNFFSLQLYAF